MLSAGSALTRVSTNRVPLKSLEGQRDQRRIVMKVAAVEFDDMRHNDLLQHVGVDGAISGQKVDQPRLSEFVVGLAGRRGYSIGEEQQAISGLNTNLGLLKLPVGERSKHRAARLEPQNIATGAHQHRCAMTGIRVCEGHPPCVEAAVEKRDEAVFGD